MATVTMSLIFVLVLVVQANARDETQFTYNGFQGSINKLHLEGLAKVLPNGLLQMTNLSISKTSHAFYPYPVIFKPKHRSFSTTFVFAMHPQIPNHSGHGLAFLISPTENFQHALPAAYLGLLNSSTNGLTSNHIFAVELDTVQNADVDDMDGNHVGIDVNSLKSVDAASAAYYSDITSDYDPQSYNFFAEIREASDLSRISSFPSSTQTVASSLMSSTNSILGLVFCKTKF